MYLYVCVRTFVCEYVCVCMCTIKLFMRQVLQPTQNVFNRQAIAILLFINAAGGARGVMVIVAESGHGDTSSNPGRD